MDEGGLLGQGLSALILDGACSSSGIVIGGDRKSQLQSGFKPRLGGLISEQKKAYRKGITQEMTLLEERDKSNKKR